MTGMVITSASNGDDQDKVDGCYANFAKEYDGHAVDDIHVVEDDDDDHCADDNEVCEFEQYMVATI